MFEPFISRVLILCALSLTGSISIGATNSYLHDGDRIMWVGDSITAQNIYEPDVMNVLHALYPDAHLTDVNEGSGGATAPSRFASIPAQIASEHPTLMTVMFGVNDTGWGINDQDQKVARYRDGLQQYIDTARKAGIPVIFIHESHFSHNQKPAPLEIGLDDLLMKLFAAEDKLASDNHVPVIDGYGAYTRELKRAWEVDPRYEFTPNFVHPTHLGHAALAGEILKAFGAGLPLSSGTERGPLHTNEVGSITLSAHLKEAKVFEASQLIPIEIQIENKSTAALNGSARVVVNHRVFSIPAMVAAGASVTVAVQLPADGFDARWTVEPIYMAFISDSEFAATETPLYASHLIPATADKPYTHDENGWVGWEGRNPHATTVSELKVTVGEQKLHTEFTWKDPTPIHARNEPYKTRAGDPVTGPLDLTSPFGQPCDAVDLLLDLRDAATSGRYTTNMDALPEGAARVGLYQIEEGGKLVSRIQVAPVSFTDRFKLTVLGNDRYAIDYAGTIPTCGVGFDVMVSDAKEYKPTQQVCAWLTSALNLGHDWVDFLRLSSGPTGIFVRVGY